MTEQIYYVPKIYCEKCGKFAEKIERVHIHKGNRRFVRAYCHGEVVETGFVRDQDAKVILWKKND